MTTTYIGDLPPTRSACLAEIRKLAQMHRTQPLEARFDALCARARSLYEAERTAAKRSAKRTARAPEPTPAAPFRTPYPPARSFRTHAERLDAVARSGVVDDTARLTPGLLRDLALRDLDARSS